MTIKTERKNFTMAPMIDQSFGVKDRLGRAIGVQTAYGECDFETMPGTATYYYTIAPGHYFVLDVQATRNGVKYGAAQAYRYFKTEAERDAALVKYLVEARKRAEKTAAR